MDNERCASCGALLSIVGRVHNCKPVSRGGVEADTQQSAPAGVHVSLLAGVAPGPRESNTYKYRDPVKRRAQVAVAMKAYRARKRANDG